MAIIPTTPMAANNNCRLKKQKASSNLYSAQIYEEERTKIKPMVLILKASSSVSKSIEGNLFFIGIPLWFKIYSNVYDRRWIDLK